MVVPQWDGSDAGALAADHRPRLKGMTAFNPFPGLRPFEPDEDHLFFGREKEIDELLRRLRSTRFLSVVGTSGSGKSSLVRSGLIPSLHSGFMVDGRLELARGDVPPRRGSDRPSGRGARPARRARRPTTASSRTPTARCSRRRCGAARSGSSTPCGTRRSRATTTCSSSSISSRSCSASGAAARSTTRATTRSPSSSCCSKRRSQSALPIYVVLTMRSDFIGDCMEYPGLPEAVNDGQYLVPRMTRDELRLGHHRPGRRRRRRDRAAPGAPAAERRRRRPGSAARSAARADADLGATGAHHQPGEPIDVDALRGDRHACETRCRGTPRRRIRKPGRARPADRRADVQGADRHVLRPARRAASDVGRASWPAICEATEAEVIAVVEIFRRPGRSFLMPPRTVPLGPRSIVDLSHESLMRCWTRLIEWARAGAAVGGVLHASVAGRALVRGRLRRAVAQSGARARPALAAREPADAGVGPPVRRRIRPRDGVSRSQRAGTHPGRGRSGAQSGRGSCSRRAGPRRCSACCSSSPACWPYVARQENRRATQNLGFAKDAVDQTLSSADRDPASAGADVPQMTEFRRELLEKAKSFYVEFLKQDARNEALRHEMALAHLRLGHINRMLEKADEAAREYQEADRAIRGLGRAIRQGRSTARASRMPTTGSGRR